MAQTVTLSSGGRLVRVVSTDSGDGDFSVSLRGDEFDAPRQEICDTPWTWLNQVHGSRVVVANSPGQGAGEKGDAVVTFARGCPVAVNTADCAPLVMTSTSGVAVVHVGWRGAAAGVVRAAAGALAAFGGVAEQTWLGPCIGPESYEFGAAELDRLGAQFGDQIRGQTSTGKPALDMHELVSAACLQAGWPAPDQSRCTSAPEFFSHRTRADVGRQATVAWIL